MVADEVRNLAMRAASAAKDTAALIQATVKKIDNGVGLVSSTNASFAVVEQSSAQLRALFDKISQASKDQFEGIDQVSVSISEMEKVVQGNAATAEESASSAEELNSQAEQLDVYVSDLIQLITGKKDKIITQ